MNSICLIFWFNKLKILKQLILASLIIAVIISCKKAPITEIPAEDNKIKNVADLVSRISGSYMTASVCNSDTSEFLNHLTVSPYNPQNLNVNFLSSHLSYQFSELIYINSNTWDLFSFVGNLDDKNYHFHKSESGGGDHIFIDSSLTKITIYYGNGSLGGPPPTINCHTIGIKD